MDIGKIEIPSNPSAWWKKKMRDRVDKIRLKIGLHENKTVGPYVEIGARKYFKDGKTLSRVEK